jgi:predicted O-linked N-acetylglucosamine transferase (SPINDLY family)
LINRGNTLHELRRHEEALASFDRALALKPDDADLHNYRGNTLRELKRLEEALASLEQALAIKPDNVEALINRGITLQDLQRCEEALASLEQALAIKPDSVEALTNRGITLQDLQRCEEALASLERALAIKPDSVEALTNRGSALHKLRRFEEALACYEKALMIRPDFAEALQGRGIILQEFQRYEEALASFEKALAIKPAFAEALHGRGNALHKLRRFEEALACYEKALMIRPDFVGALLGRGIILQEFQRYEEALASYHEALARSPNDAMAHNNCGYVLQDLQRYDEAITSFEKALAIRPDFEYAAGMLVNARMHCCDWRRRDEEVGRLKADIRAGNSSISPFMFLGVSDSPQDQLLCSRISVRDQYPASPVPIWKGERYHHDRIRLAYVSADFRMHPSSFLLAGMFEHHDRSRFETIAISFGPDDRSEIRTRVKEAFEDFIDVRSRSDLEVARLMREREVDIAVDLMGHTRFCRKGILALRPAPIQVNYLGYPGTIGAEFIDYIVADKFVIPIDHQGHYAEKIAYLPECFQANDSMRRINERALTRADSALPEQRFVFCCLNNIYKLTPPFFNVWMRLLQKVDHSVLWLQQGNAAAVSNLRREAQARSIDPGRLIFSPRVKPEDYLANYRLADLFLDTLPFNGGATASDALWAGLPVLTCAGSAFAGRMAGSILHAIGLPEMVTNTLEEYEALALKLATQPGLLLETRARLAENRRTAPLFDTDRFCRHIEAAYTRMWERSQRGEPPVSFAVAPIDN